MRDLRITALYVTVLHIAAILLFCNGFLLTRIVLEDQSVRNLQTVVEPTFKKAVILIIDALRYDFTQAFEHADKAYQNHFTVLRDIVTAEPENAFLTQFIAHPPTTTLQRIKGLTTGSLPTFVDAGSNFGGEAILEDNWLAQLRSNNKSLAFVGDDTWQALYPNTFSPTLNFPFESLNVWDLDTVDDGVYHHLFRSKDALLGPSKDEWDVLIAHTLGLDHAGHRYGPSHPELSRKLRQMDDWVKEIIGHIDNETLLIVMGDHGMNAEGDHGGDSYDEVTAALFMYSKRQFFAQLPASLETERSNQIDLVPTLSLLLGVPIPFNNLGVPIRQAFSANPVTPLQDAVKLTSHQVRTYISRYTLSLPSLSKHLDDLLADHHVDSVEAQFEMLATILHIFERQWAQYHIPSIVAGILIMFLAGLLSMAALANRSTSFLASLASGMLLIFSIVLRDNMPMLYTITYLLSFLLSGAYIYTSSNKGITISRQIERPDLPLTVALVALVSHLLIFTSNSFTIHEDRIMLLLVNSLILVASLSLCKKHRKQTIRTILYAVELMVGSRLASTIRLCREEQGPACISNFSNVDVSYLFIFSVIAVFILVAFLHDLFKSTQNLTSTVTIWLVGFVFNLILAWAYWTCDILAFSASTKFIISRSLFGSVLVQTVAWYFHPLPISFSIIDGQLRVTGGDNMRGTSYLLLLLPISSLLVFLGRSLGLLSLMILMLQLCLLTSYTHLTPFFRAVLVSQLAHLHFFTTGHQMALPTIQWDLAFLLSTTIKYPLSPLLITCNAFGSFILVALYTPLLAIWRPSLFPRVAPSDQAAVHGTTPATSKSKNTERSDTRTEASHANDTSAWVLGSLGLQLYFSLTTLTTMIFATHFRRHLMVWKIFAPRFMCAAFILLVVDVAVLFSFVCVGLVDRKIEQLRRTLSGGR